MTKSDRWARMARDMKYTRPFLEHNVAALLHRQFSAIRQLVKTHPRAHRFDGARTAEYIRGYGLACKDLLAALDRWRKGKP